MMDKLARKEKIKLTSTIEKWEEAPFRKTMRATVQEKSMAPG